MIKFIAAIDSKRGVADDKGIPWDLPTDKQYFRDETTGSNVMMGYGWYKEQQLPLPNRRNIVATTKQETLRPGFEQTNDARLFLKDFKVDIWVGGGAALFASTLDLADELYLTHVEGDFGCTKFFPEYEKVFRQTWISEPRTENGITFRFARYARKTS